MILKNFKGYLQTDGYVAYDAFAQMKDVMLIHCMAHARRMFKDASGGISLRLVIYPLNLPLSVHIYYLKLLI